MMKQRVRFEGNNFYKIAGLRKYFIDEAGIIISRASTKKTKNFRVLKLNISDSGLLYFEAREDNLRKRIFVHIAVLLTFKGKANGCRPLHLDGNKLNNEIKNLVWVTVEEFKQHRQRFQKYCKGEDVWISKLTPVDVVRMRRLKKNKTYHAIADEFGVSYATVYAAIHGKTWKHVNGGSVDLTPPKPLLNVEQVKNIRRMAKDGISYKKISEQFNVTVRQVNLIIAGQSWPQV